MPIVCTRQKRSWYNNRTGAVTFSKHMPTAGRGTHSLTKQVPTSFGVRRVTPWNMEINLPYVSEGLSAYPDLLNKYIVAKLSRAIHTVVQVGPIFARAAPEQPAIKAQAVFKESGHWRDPLRGAIEPTEK